MTRYSLAHLTALRASPPELIRIAGQAGYDYVGLRLLEVTGGDAWPLATNSQLLRDTKDAMAAYNVGVLDIELVRLTPEFAVESLVPTLEAAAELGARHVLTQAHDMDWARLVDNFGRVADLVADYSMTVDVEFLTWTPMRGVKDVKRLLDAADRSNAGLMVDTLHFFRSHCAFSDLECLSPDRFHFVQIADAPAVGPTDNEGLIFAAREDRLEPGMGGLDLEGLLLALPEDVAIAVEIPSSRLAQQFNDEERARRALDATKSVVANVQAARVAADQSRSTVRRS